MIHSQPTDGAPNDAKKDRGPSARNRLWTSVALGVAGGLGVAAAGVFISGKIDEGTYDDNRQAALGDCGESDAQTTLCNSVKSKVLATRILAGGAAAAAVVSAVLFFVEGRSSKKESRVRLKWRLMPMVGRETGAMFEARF